ncbi:MAG TPA: efflux RND transporter permease subunit, partial [Vicinamibacterales bacterium]|nr:efflux RND transporter permease subunit [Vicinamibacterales bacterium]
MSRPDNGADSVARHGFVDRVVSTFLHSNLSLVLLLLASALGITALYVTPREEDPQIVVPLADIFVRVPGRSAAEVEQLVSTPLEKILYQIDGVEYVYSMSRPDEAIITVRFYVGEDRERSLVKLFKKIDEHMDIVPPGVAGWVVKPVEIDDVPIVTLALRPRAADGSSTIARSAKPMPDEFGLRRVAEELAERLAAASDVSRAYVVGGRPRVVHVRLDADRMRAYEISALEVQRAIQATNVRVTAGDFHRGDAQLRVEAGPALTRSDELGELIVGAAGGRLARLRDVAKIEDGPAEAASYVRHGWGPAAGFTQRHGFPGTAVAEAARAGADASAPPVPAVTIAIAKKKGANAVAVADAVLRSAARLQSDLVPDDMELIVTRNYGLTADDKVNELVEGLAVAIIIVVALLTLALGWREALIVALAVPVVFGLTLIVNELAGYTINRVTLFALILSLGLLVDDPIVDVENIARHFGLRGAASREIVRQAVAEIRPPLITATLAVIVSFVPMFFITGMMGPYMRPMALNVPVAMLMSMVVAFTITPWLSFHMLKARFARPGASRPDASGQAAAPDHAAEDDPDRLRGSLLYRMYRPLMAPLLRSRTVRWGVLAGVAGLTVVAAGLAAVRVVPLKMLPFDNKNELLLVLDFDEGTSLERSDAAVRAFEARLASVPEVSDFTSYVGVASPMDFNGLVRHYYLRSGANVAEIRVNLAGKRNRVQQSHAVGLRLRDELTTLARRHSANLKIVELPPGPPVIATLVAEVYGRADQPYEALLAAARTVRARLEREPGVVDVDSIEEAPMRRKRFVTDREKAALSGVTVEDVAATLRIALGGESAGTVRDARERNPLRIVLQLPEAARSTLSDLSRLHVKGRGGALTPLAELGRWEESRVDQTIYHKNLERVVYVFAETAGRAPAEAIVDIMSDRVAPGGPSSYMPDGTNGSDASVEGGLLASGAPRPLAGRAFLSSGGGIPWSVPEGIRVAFAGEGEWKITLDVFRDLGIAFAAALVGIYILLVAQTGSFVIPVVVMLAIPLTVLGVMPGFWLLNLITGQTVGGYPDPVFFTATG